MRNLLQEMKDCFRRSRLDRSGQVLVSDGNRTRKARGMRNRQGSARRSFQGNRGETLVEFALVLPLFFLLIFSILDLGHMYYVQLTLENAMRQAGRFAVTGNHLDPPGTSRVDSIIQVARNAAAGLDVTDIQISSVNGGSTGPGRAGGPGDTVTIKLTVNLKLITKYIGRFFTGGTNTYTVSTTFRNESFPASQTL